VLCGAHLQDWKEYYDGVSETALSVYRAEINHALRETNLQQITQSGREIKTTNHLGGKMRGICMRSILWVVVPGDCLIV